MNKTTIWLLVAAILLSPVMAGEETDPDADWSQWRGPNRDGTVSGPDWPVSFAGLTMRWSVPLGKGYPGPIVAGDRVFVVESVDKQEAAVRALEVATGQEIWRHTWPSSGKVPFFATRNGSWIRSTPAWDGQTLYVGDMREVLMALDGKTGQVRWKADLPERYQEPVPDFGFASSPLLDGDHVYVQAANSLLKLDRSTGETVWRGLVGGGSMTASGAFSSPIMATLAGQKQLVVQTRMTLYGVDMESGEALWSVDVPNFRGMNILTPVAHGDGVLTSSYKNATYFFNIRRDGEAWVVSKAWENKASAYMSSPVIIDGHAYLHLGNRRIDCIDLSNGESRWRSEPFGEYWSMAVQGDRILALDADGTLHLVKASSDSFQPLASQPVADEETWGHLAVKGRRLFIRGLTAVSVWDWAEPDQVASR